MPPRTRRNRASTPRALVHPGESDGLDTRDQPRRAEPAPLRSFRARSPENQGDRDGHLHRFGTKFRRRLGAVAKGRLCVVVPIV